MKVITIIALRTFGSCDQAANNKLKEDPISVAKISSVIKSDKDVTDALCSSDENITQCCISYSKHLNDSLHGSLQKEEKRMRII